MPAGPAGFPVLVKVVFPLGQLARGLAQASRRLGQRRAELAQPATLSIRQEVLIAGPGMSCWPSMTNPLACSKRRRLLGGLVSALFFHMAGLALPLPPGVKSLGESARSVGYHMYVVSEPFVPADPGRSADFEVTVAVPSSFPGDWSLFFVLLYQLHRERVAASRHRCQIAAQSAAKAWSSRAVLTAPAQRWCASMGR